MGFGMKGHSEVGGREVAREALKGHGIRGGASRSSPATR